MNLTDAKDSRIYINVSGFETETISVVSEILLLHFCQVPGCENQLLPYISASPLLPDNKHPFM
jgi:hypothetical protein